MNLPNLDYVLDNEPRTVPERLAANVKQLIDAADLATTGVLIEIRDERRSQDEKWGEQNHVDDTGYSYLKEKAAIAKRECDTAFASGNGSWRLILREEFCEVLAETDPAKVREELIQVAAVAVNWIEAIDRRTRS